MLIPLNMPLWPSYDALGCTYPLLASLLNAIKSYINLTILLSLLFILIDTATVQWQKNRLFFTAIALLLGMLMIDLPSIKMIPLWIVIGGIVGYILLALYQHVIRYNYSLIPLATGAYVILHLVQQGIFNAYPYAWLAAIINIVVVSVISLLWYWYTHKTR